MRLDNGKGSGATKRSAGLNKDFGAGLIVVAAGVFAAVHGASYGFGTLQRTGPGLFPTLLGVLLALIGLAIMAGSFEIRQRGAMTAMAPDRRGSACIILGVVAFIVAGEHLGLLAGSFACVFIAALGDRYGSLRAALILGIGVAIFAVVLFSLILKIQIPIVRWA
jgi:hypothetical protein